MKGHSEHKQTLSRRDFLRTAGVVAAGLLIGGCQPKHPENLPRLFIPFYTTKNDGMGLGLAISRSIIGTHGGRLEAIPNDDRGTVFRFTLPARNEQKLELHDE